MILYLREAQERERLKALSKEAVARYSEEPLELKSAQEAGGVKEYMKQVGKLDMACMDVAKAEDIRLLKELKGRHLQVDIFLVADSSVSPMEYLTPEIRAASLLLRPYEEEQCERVAFKFFRSYFQPKEVAEEKKALVVKGQEGKVVIQYWEIYYIEIREHKVFIRLKNKEYSQYDTLEHVLEQLPDTFLRCHRSFAFNTEHFDSVKLSGNEICLKDGVTVPLSRSFKPMVKEFVHELHRI